MRETTKEMVKEFKIKKLGYDMMGYPEQQKDLITFHHLIIPHRHCKEQGLGEGYLRWNGAILYTTPHEYLHLIEAKDYEIFLAITSELIEENVKGFIDQQNLRYIDDCLTYFEREHCSDRSKKGKLLIKEQYLHRNNFMV